VWLHIDVVCTARDKVPRSGSNSNNLLCTVLQMMAEAHSAQARAEQQAASYKLELSALHDVTKQLQAEVGEAACHHSGLLAAFKHERKLAEKQHRLTVQEMQAQYAVLVRGLPMPLFLVSLTQVTSLSHCSPQHIFTQPKSSVHSVVMKVSPTC
jgi:hypothetical protein